MLGNDSRMFFTNKDFFVFKWLTMFKIQKSMFKKLYKIDREVSFEKE